MTIRANPNRGQLPTHYVLCDGRECSRVSAAPLARQWMSVTIYAGTDGFPHLLHFHHLPCLADWVVRREGRSDRF